MTQPLLHYQAPGPWCRSGIVTAAWIFLLTLGVLYCLLGTCLGVGFIFIQDQLPRRFANPQVALILMRIVIAVFIVSGILYVWTALVVRRPSAKGALVGIIAALLNAATALVIVAATLLRISRGVPNPRQAVFSSILYAVLCLINAIAAGLLIGALRRIHRTLPVESSRPFTGITP